MDCIFMRTPEECATCMDSRKLQCVLNKRHLMVKGEAKELLRNLLEEELNTDRRYKIVPGQAQRKGG